MLFRKIVVDQSTLTTGLRVGAPSPQGIRTINPNAAALPPAAQATGAMVPLPGGRRPDTTIIAIADDSPIECVDVYLGGRDAGRDRRFRIAPGTPFIGEIEDDMIVVVGVRTFGVSFFAGSDNFYWDATPLPVISSDQWDNTARWPFAILNIWRLKPDEDTPEIDHYQRAPLEAMLSGTTNAGPRGAALWACTDGRRVADVQLYPIIFGGGGASATINYYGFDSILDVSQGSGLRSIANGTLLASGAVAVGQLFSYEWSGSPYQYQAVQVIPNSGTLAFSARISARDS